MSFDSAEKTQTAYNKLKNSTSVEFVEINEKLKTGLAKNEGSKYNSVSTSETELASFLRDKEITKEVKVAILDTGIDKTFKQENIIDLGINYSTSGKQNNIEDDNGHGTELAKLILENSDENVKIMPIKVADKNGNSSVYKTYQGIMAAIENKADIINISMNSYNTKESKVLEDAINKAEENGIKVLSSGNDRIVPELMERASGTGSTNYIVGASTCNIANHFTSLRTNGGYLANQVYTITFLENQAGMDSNDVIDSWDISKYENGSVMAWITDAGIIDGTQMYNLFIGGNGTGSIVAPSFFDTWFYNYKKCVTIDGLDILDTSSVTTMLGLFEDCTSLTNLDLGDKFDTSNVTNMYWMFINCNSLISLELGDKFDTSNVTDMRLMFRDCTSLTNLDLGDKFDTSNVTTMELMFYNCKSLTSLDLGNKFDTSNVTDMSSMFYKCNSLTSLDLGDKFDTSNVTDMEQMFYDCKSLTSLDLGDKFNTSNVTCMDRMFIDCSSLTKLDLGEKFYTTKVKSMYAMFQRCTSLTSLDLSSFDTNAIVSSTDMTSMLEYMTNLNILILGSNFIFKSSNVLDSYSNPSKWLRIGTEEYYTSSELTRVYNGTMAGEYKRITYTIEFNGNGATSGSTASQTMYGGTAANLNANGFRKRDSRFIGWNTKSDGTGISYLESQSVINLINQDDGIVILYAQWGYPRLMERETITSPNYQYIIGQDRTRNYRADRVYTITILNNQTDIVNSNVLDSWDVSENSDETIMAWITSAGLIDEKQMYNLYIGSDGSDRILAPIDSTHLFSSYINCISIDGLNFLDTSDVIDMTAMFYKCNSLTSLNLENNLDTSNVIDMSYMFYHCESLQTLDLSAFNTINVTDYVSGGGTSHRGMLNMFAGCSSLTNLNLGNNFNTSNVCGMAQMFLGCENLTSIDLGNKFDTSNVYEMDYMFDGCKSLINIDLGDKFDTSNVTDMNYMFNDCKSLINIDLGDKFDTSNVTDMSFMFNDCKSLINIDLGDKFDTSNVRNMTCMFANCSGISSLDISCFDTSSVTDSMYRMLSGLENLESLTLGENFEFKNASNITIFATPNSTDSWYKVVGENIYSCSELEETYTSSMAGEYKRFRYNIEYYQGNNSNIAGATLLGSSQYEGDSILTKYSDLGGVAPTGWTFAGWSSVDCITDTTVTYTNGQTINYLTTVPNGTVRLYAIFKRKIRFNSGVNCATKEDVEQRYNPYKTTGSITEVTAPVPSVTNLDTYGWSYLGYNLDNSASTPTYTVTTVPVNLMFAYDFENSSTTINLYAAYNRIITIYHGKNKATNTTRMQYYNTKGNNCSEIEAPVPSITNMNGWTAKGYRTDTIANSATYTVTTIAVNIKPAYNVSNTLYAVYSRNLSMAYNGNENTGGSTADHTLAQYYNTNDSVSSVTFTTQTNGFTKTGYRFSKWANDSVEGTQVSAGGTAEPFSPAFGATGEQLTKTMYAIWTANTYTIDYYQGNNSTTSGATKLTSSSHTYDVAANLTAYTGTAPSGWTFAGWSATGATSATTVTYTDGQSVSNLTSTNNGTVKLYAIFKKTINVYSGVSKGTNASQEQRYNPYKTTYVSSITLNIPAEISSWTPLGYRTNETATTATTSVTTSTVSVTPTYNSNPTYYAVYSRVLTITYNGNDNTGGSTADSTKTVYLNTDSTTTSDQTVTLKTNGFSKTGYTFSKWAEGSVSGTQYSASASYTPNVAYNSESFGKTMYAIWTANTYTIEYYQGKNSTTAGANKLGSSTHTYDLPSNLTIYSGTAPSGWTFAGWSATGATSATTVTYTDGQSVSNLTSTNNGTVKLYAIFKKTINVYSGVSKETNASQEQRYNPYKTTYISSISLEVPTAITNWTTLGYRTDTTATTASTSVTTSAVAVTPVYNATTTSYYAVYSRVLTISYNGSGNTGGSTANTTKTVYLNTDSTTTSDQGVTLKANGYTKTGYSFTKWAEESTLGTKYSANTIYNPNVTYNAGTFGKTMYAIWEDTVAPAITVTRSDYNTFNWTATDADGVTGYQITTSSTTPDVNGEDWVTTGTLTSGSNDVTEAKTYYVWAKDSAGHIGNASIRAYTLTRSEGSGSTLTLRVDSTSNTTGTEITENTVAIVGTPIWTKAVLNTGYNNVILKINGTSKTASGTSETISANTTVVSTATANTYTIEYYKGNNSTTSGATKITSSSHTYNVSKALTAFSGTAPTGWTFAGWSANGGTSSTTVEYENKESVINLTTTNGATIKLYAIFKRTINVYSGVDKITNNSQEQRYNPYRTTYLSSITLGIPTAITNWTTLGYRTDTIATTAATTVTTEQKTVTPAYNAGTDYYAVYSRVITINYDGNGYTGGSMADTTKTVYLNTNSTTTSDQSVTLKANGFSKTGYTFSKWAEESISGTQYSASTSYNPNLDYASGTFGKTMYAIWADTVAPTVTVTKEDYNTFSFTASDVDGVTGYQITRSNTVPDKNGEGWITSGTLTNGTYDASLSGTYYVWAKDNAGNVGSASIAAYTVTRSEGIGTTLTLRVDGTSNTTGIEVTENTAVLIGTSIWTKAVTNVGYNTPVLKIGGTTKTASGTSVTISANTTVASTATANTYTVEYYQGSSKLTSSSHTYGTANNLIAYSGTAPTGWTFSGWSAAGGTATTDVTYVNKESVINLSSTNNGTVKIYAIFKRTIKFNSGISGATTSSIEQRYNPYSSSRVSEVLAPLPSVDNLTEYNWSPLGYRVDNTAGSATYAVTSTETNIKPAYNVENTSTTVNLYAVYSRTVTLYHGKEKASNSKPVQYYNSNGNIISTISAPAPSVTNLTGWVALGYRRDTDANTATYVVTTSATNISPAYNIPSNLYAVYNKTLTISYDGNGNTGGSTSPTTKTVYLNTNSTTTSDQEVTLKSNGFSKTGYSFTKWAEESVTGIQYSANTSYTPNVAYNSESFGKTMYAIWEDTVAPKVRVTRSDYNTIGWTVSDEEGVTGYQITTSSTAPDLNGEDWVTTGIITSGTYDISEEGTYYVWAKDSAGNIGGSSISAYTLIRNENEKSTLTIRVDGASGTTGTELTENIVVLSGTPVWSKAVAKSGYNTPVLTVNGVTKTASGTSVTITANTTVASTATANTYTVEYYQGNNNTSSGATKLTSSVHTYSVAQNLTTYSGTAPSGWTFAGWSVAGGTTTTTVTYTNKESVINLTTTNGATIKLYAIFKKTINVYSGVNKATNEVQEQRYNPYKTTYVSSISLEVPTEITNWEKLGYRTDTNDDIASVTVTTAKVNITPAYNAGPNYYAVYKRVLTVSYNGNNSTSGSLVPTTKDIYLNTNDLATSSQVITLANNGFTKTGYNFSKWAEGSASGTQYDENTSYTAGLSYNAGTFGKTMYAVWIDNIEPVVTVEKSDYNTFSFTASDGVGVTGYKITTTNTKPGVSDSGWITNETLTSGTYDITEAGTYYVWAKDSSGNVNSETNASKITAYLVTRSEGTGSMLTTRVDSTNESTGVTITANTAVLSGTSLWVKAVASIGYNTSILKINNVAKTASGTTTTITSATMIASTATANIYTITYNSNKPAGTSSNITGTTANSAHTYDVAKNLTSNGYRLEGYTFGGWTSNQDGTGDSFTDGQSVTNLSSTNEATVVLYAKWTANTYSVEYNSNKPSGASSNVTGTTAKSNHVYNTAKNLTTNGYSLTGYTFGGWTKNVDGTGTSYINGQSVTNLTSTNGATVTLYAKWIKNTYNITLDNGSATTNGTDKIYEVYDENIYLDSNKTKVMTTSNNKITIPERKYTVTYNANAGTCLTPSQTATYTFNGYYDGLSQMIGSNGFITSDFINNKYSANKTLNSKWTPGSVTTPEATKEGYNFLGWYDSSIGGNKVVDGNTSYTPAGNIELFARFSADEVGYKIQHWQQKVTGTAGTLNSTNYDLKDTENLTGEADSTVIPSLKTYTGFTARSIAQEVTIKPDGTLVVNYYYDRESYTVTLNKGTGIASVTGAGSYLYGATVTIDAILSSGYSWSKWTGTHNINTKNYTFTMPVNVVTDTANGAVITYSITYDYDGGSLPEGKTNPEEYTVETENFKLENPEKYGYKFIGWTESDTDEPEIEKVIEKGTTGNKELIANYEIDETQTKTLSYTVEYYKDNVKVDGDTQTETRIVQVLQPDTLEVDKTKINTTNKYTGYGLDEDNTNVPDTVNSGDTIKVYYVHEAYTITYNYNGGILPEGKTNPEEFTVETENFTLENPEKYGYKFIGWTENDTDEPEIEKVIEKGTTGNKELTANYEIDETQTKTLSYTVEYYKDNVKVDGDTQTETKTVQVLQLDTLEVDKTKINTTNKYTGYRLDAEHTNVPDTVNNGDTIKVYYVKDNFGYRVEYYYDGSIDSAKTENLSAEYGSLVNTYADKNISGYKLEKVEGLPLTITEVSANNVIKVYYVLDDGNTKTLSYIVEYYKDGTKVDGDTQTETKTVQILQPDTLEVDKTKINTTNKYTGYRLESTEPVNIPDTVTSGDTIKVYYVHETYSITYNYNGGALPEGKTNPEEYTVETENFTLENPEKYGYKFIGWTENNTDEPEIEKVIEKGTIGNKELTANYEIDETQTKELSYTVEYYKDGTKVDGDTQTETKTVQVLEPDTISVDKTKINTTNKYTGYRLDEDHTNIPDIVNNRTIIKVYYVKDNFGYRVEYYYDGSIDSAKTENLSAEYGSLVNTYADKNISGYKLEKVEGLPLTITEVSANNVIKVYYVLDDGNTKTLTYTVEYYKDNVKVDGDTQTETRTVQVLQPDTISVDKTKINTTNKYTGYRLDEDHTNIPNTVNSGATIKVYYVHETYTITYNYNGGTLPEGKTNPEEYTVETEIFTLENPEKYGYKFIGWTENNTDEPEIEKVIEKGTIGNKVLTANYEIDEIQTKTLSYTVEYYKDGTKVTSDTQTETRTVQVLQPDTISIDRTLIENNNKYTGYRLNGTNPETVPNTVNSGTIIKVYYEKENYGYTVEYYYDGSIDSAKTERLSGEYGSIVNTYTDKNINGYRLENVEGMPLTITEVPANNVIKVYYVLDDGNTKTLSYIVEYYKDGTKVDGDTQTETKTVQILQPDTLEVDKTKINTTNKYTGYRLDEEHTNVQDTVNNGDIIKVYYVHETYTITYNYNGGALPEGKTNPEEYTVETENFTLLNPEKYGYKFIGWTENDTDEPEIEKIIEKGTTGNKELTANYEIDETQTKELSYTVEYYKDGTKVDRDTYTETRTVQVLELDTVTVDRTLIEDNNKYFGYKIDHTVPETVTNTVDNGVTIKVYYVHETYSITYFYDGGELPEGKINPEEYTVETESFTLENPEKYGYKFIGWTEKDTDEPEIEKVVEKGTTGNKIFTANYEVDENQTKELSYTIEFYKNNEKVDEKAIIQPVQVLKPNTVVVDKSLINNNKYPGYKISRTEPAAIPDIVDNGTVLKVYYILDDGQSKEVSYTIEYYKDNEKVDEKTVTEMVQLLEPDTIEIDKTLINNNNKYSGYELERTNPEIVEDIVDSGTIIEVYYVHKTYTISYNYNGGLLPEGVTNPEEYTVEKENFTINNPEKEGYKFIGWTENDGDTPEFTKVIEKGSTGDLYLIANYELDEEQTKELSYTIEYYKNNEKVDTRVVTKTVHILEPNELILDNSLINDKFLGFKLDRLVSEISGEILIGNKEHNNVGSLASSNNSNMLVIKGDKRVLLNINGTIVVTNGDILRAYYEYETYTISYNYNGGSLPDGVTNPEEYTIETDDFTIGNPEKEGYKFIGWTENENDTPELTKVIEKGNMGDKLFIANYEEDEEQTKEISYTVEYYKENELQENDTQVETEIVHILDEDIIEVDLSKINTENKYEGYVLEKTIPETIPNTVIDGEVIKVYYVRQKYDYKVEYYYGGIRDNELTEEGRSYKGDVIKEYTNKPKEGYELDRVESLPLVISDTETNVIKIYYLPIRTLTINHIDSNTNEVLETIVRHGKEGTIITTEPKDYDGYRLVLRPQLEEYVLEDSDITVNYYYSKVTGGLEKHIDVINGKLLGTETIEKALGEVYETTAKDIDGYIIATNRRYYRYLAKENPSFLSDNGVSSVEEYLEKANLDPSTNYIPENSTGLMEDGVEVKYYYMPKVSLKVQYVDINDDEEIIENNENTSIIIEGNLDEPYETTPKEFDEYLRTSNKRVYDKYIQENPDILEENGVETAEEYMNKENIDPSNRYVPENAIGTMDIIENGDGTYKNEIIVTYYYGIKRKITIKYLDLATGEEVEEELSEEGPEGDSYDIENSLKQIEGYTLVEKPDTTEGIYDEQNVSKTYYYAKNSQVIVKYVDKDTGKIIDESANYIIEGYEGKDYTTLKKVFGEYTYLDNSENTEGTMGSENTEVIYYYKKNTSNNSNPITTNTDNKELNELTQTVTTIASNTVSDQSTKVNTTNNKPQVEKDVAKKDSIVQRIVNPKTGDIVPIIAYSTIASLLIVNLILVYVGEKRLEKLEKRSKSKHWVKSERKKEKHSK